ncbi:hypothetical protein EIP86_002648 [Pleurotus ostreatoroseus]|nr:hypothetical protein EIP86_002648 [Pleurotus ostreatoroseus]
MGSVGQLPWYISREGWVEGQLWFLCAVARQPRTTTDTDDGADADADVDDGYEYAAGAGRVGRRCAPERVGLLCAHAAAPRPADRQGANFASWILLTITLYDWVLMLHREIESVWCIRPRTRAGTVIYFVNRYFMIASVVFLVAGTVVSSSLEGYVRVVFAALRIFAIWEASYSMGAMVFVLYVVPLGLSLFEAFRVQVVAPKSPNVMGCLRVKETLDIRCEHLRKDAPVASDVLMVASDALVLFMTWTKTRKIQKEAERMDLKLKLYMLLLRDGSLHFLMQLILTIADLVLLSAQPTTQLQTGDLYPLLGMSSELNGLQQDDYLNPFLNALQSIVISHFILSLRQILLATEVDDETYVLGTMSWLGNVGAPLSTHHDVDSEIVFARGSYSSASLRPKSSPNPLAYGLPQAGAHEESIVLLDEDRKRMDETKADLGYGLEVDSPHDVGDFFDDPQYGLRVLKAMHRGNTMEMEPPSRRSSPGLPQSPPPRRGSPLARTPPPCASPTLTPRHSRSPLAARLASVGVHTPVSVHVSESSLCLPQSAEVVEAPPVPPVPRTPPSTYTAPRRSATAASRRTVGSEFRRVFEDDVEYGRKVLRFIRRSDTQDSGAHSPTELDAADQPESLALLAHEP